MEQLLLNPADLPSRQNNSHIRSSSSGGTLMVAGNHRHGQNDTRDSQITLISHSSSQNDLSRLVDSQGTSLIFDGIINPSFQFSQHSLHRPSDSLNQSEA
jgi:hypothetical protein